MLTRFSSYCLIHGAFLVRRRSYEQFALQAHGISAKATVEIMTILYNIFNLVAFFIVIGDLGPDIVSMWFKIPSEYYEHVRVAVMALIALGVVLPLSLLRNADSLSSFSSMAILFYAGFVIRMLIAALSQMWDGDWMDKVLNLRFCLYFCAKIKLFQLLFFSCNCSPRRSFLFPMSYYLVPAKLLVKRVTNILRTILDCLV